MIRGPRSGGGDAGFTLLELVVVVALVGIVGTVVGTAALQSVRITQATAGSLTDTSARYGVASAFLADVRGATAMGSTGGPTCADPAGGSRIFWASRDDAVAAYSLVEAAADHPAQLIRVVCAAGTADRSTVLAEWSATTSVTVGCDGRPGCDAASVPRSAVLAVPDAVGPDGRSTLPGYSVTAVRRTS